MRSLDRKLLRDLRQMGGQVATIALVVAAGIAAYVTMQSTYSSLEDSRDAYYDRERFGHVFAHLERAPKALVRRIEDVPGIARAYDRVVEGALLPMPGMTEPAVATLVSLPSSGRPPLNDVVVRTGRRPEPGSADEALVLETFAEAHGLEPGDTIPAVINGTRRELRVSGTAMSPEYVFAIGPSGMTAEPDAVGVLWMDREALAAAFGLEGAFNDVVVALQPGGTEVEVLASIDRLIEPYGGLGAVGRSKQTSNYFLEGELSQLEQMATVVPFIFLGVAAFLVNVVLSRLVHLQRPEIAALKALGYTDWSIAFHYLKLVSAIVILGALLGLVVGKWLGREYTELYLQYFKFPTFEHRVTARVATVAIAISVGAAVVGALVAARGIMKLPPAEAMRPAPPASYERSVSERLGLFALLGPAGRMIAREVERRPLRTLLSALGIAMAVGILVVGRFMSDAMDSLLENQFQRAWREDVAVGFFSPVPERAVREMAHLPGVLRAEGSRMLPVRFQSGPRYRDAVIHAVSDDVTLRQVVTTHGEVVPVPEDGLLMTSKLGEILGVSVGDEVLLEVREGERPERRVTVAGLVEESFGLQGYMDADALHALLGEQPSVNTVLMRIDPVHWNEIHRRLEEIPGVASVMRKDALVQRFREQSGDMMMTMTMIMTIFASVIAIGVVYNNARVVLSMRSRDLASLRVLGFKRSEISAMLLGELSIQVFLAIPIGLVIGTWMAEAIMATADPEQYRMVAVISEKTYAFATLVTLAAGLVSALLVRRKLDKLDLIGVLKTRE